MSELLTNSDSDSEGYNVGDMANVPDEARLALQQALSKLPRGVRAAALAGALSATRKTRAGGRPKVMKKCPNCKLPFSARELGTHEPKCRAIHNPSEEPRAGRPLGWRKPATKRAKVKSKG